MHHLPFNLTFWSCVRRYFLLPDTLNLDTLLVCAHEPLQGPLETFAITGCFSLFQRALDLYTFKRILIRRVPSILRIFLQTNTPNPPSQRESLHIEVEAARMCKGEGSSKRKPPCIHSNMDAFRPLCALRVGGNKHFCACLRLRSSQQTCADHQHSAHHHCIRMHYIRQQHIHQKYIQQHSVGIISTLSNHRYKYIHQRSVHNAAVGPIVRTTDGIARTPQQDAIRHNKPQ